MAVSACEEDINLREWAPLTDLFQKLPTKTQNGLFNSDLKITCVDVIAELIILGSNCGIVYCYDRKRNDLQRLRCENINCPVTAVKIISTVDYMVACGNRDGNISIFQIPKIPPDSLPASLRPKNKQVERYTVSEMHKGAVTALEWSKNGMKLFSGDATGHVVLTEIDFYMHLCKSIEILNEAYEVVQISYHQQQLLISTTYRSIVCQKQDKWKVSQVGKKDRKILGSFGGIIYQNGIRPTDIILYCSRPGLRIWISDIKGLVQQTLLFKDILSQKYPEVPILNPLASNLKRLKPNKEASFGKICAFSDELLITYNNDVVYILNPKELKIIATVSHLRGVLDVAVNKDEIFILEGERSLIRLAFTPEITKEVANNSTTNTAFTPLSSSIKELTSKIQSTNIIAAIPPIIESSLPPNDQTTHSPVEEAKECAVNNIPVKVATDPTYSDKVYESYRKQEIYNKIAEQDFDETILFKHGRHKKHDMNASTYSLSSSSSEEKDANVIKPTVMNMSTVGVLPDLRSPDSIQNDIEQKEKMLADLLNFDKPKAVVAEENIVPEKTNLSLDIKKDIDKIISKPPPANASDDADEDKPGVIVDVRNKKQNGCVENKIKKNIENGFMNITQKATAVFRQFPPKWHIAMVNLSESDSSNESLDDWEIV